MSSGTFQISVPAVARPRPRPRPARPTPGRRRPAQETGTGLLRLFGIALLGWVGLMAVVTALAV